MKDVLPPTAPVARTPGSRDSKWRIKSANRPTSGRLATQPGALPTPEQNRWPVSGHHPAQNLSLSPSIKSPPLPLPARRPRAIPGVVIWRPTASSSKPAFGCDASRAGSPLGCVTNGPTQPVFTHVFNKLRLRAQNASGVPLRCVTIGPLNPRARPAGNAACAGGVSS